MRSYKKILKKLIMGINCMSLLLGSFVTVAHAQSKPGNVGVPPACVVARNSGSI